MQGVAKAIQNVRAVELAPTMVESMQCGIGDARFFLEFVARPALAGQNLFQFADDHSHTLGQSKKPVKSPLYLKYYLPIRSIIVA